MHIHEALLGLVSPALRAAYQGGWEESKSKVYKFLKDDDGFFTDVTRELLICFVRWAYIGDYSTEIVGVASEPKKLEETTITNRSWKIDHVHYIDTGTDWQPIKYKMKGGKKCKWCVAGHKPNINPVIRDSELDQHPTLEEPAIITDEEKNLDKTNIATNSTSREDSSTPLHALALHIRIYVFANIYLISTLQALSQQKIVAFLSSMQKEHTEVAMIFDLLEHASTYLTDDDALLNWLARYASWNLETLRQDRDRLERLLGDGKFAGLLIRHVVPSASDPFASV